MKFREILILILILINRIKCCENNVAKLTDKTDGRHPCSIHKDSSERRDIVVMSVNLSSY